MMIGMDTAPAARSRSESSAYRHVQMLRTTPDDTFAPCPERPQIEATSTLHPLHHKAAVGSIIRPLWNSRAIVRPVMRTSSCCARG